MNRKQVKCRGCVHADIHVISVYRNIHPLSFLGREANELSIWCKVKMMNIRYPYMECKHRTERPKIAIDQWRFSELSTLPVDAWKTGKRGV